MKKWSSICRVALAVGLAAASGSGFAYTSPSTGADGAFAPTTSQAVQLPPSGVFNFTTVNIPSGVTITFIKNATNTPVTILATGDVTIAGAIDVSATPPASSLDITGPGQGGPGGYNGGRGGMPAGVTSGWVAGYVGSNVGGSGIGPGGGSPAQVYYTPTWVGWNLPSGGGGAYGSAPAAPGNYCPAYGGATYGNTTLIPMIGGSGGGGGAGGVLLPGSGGGGGGGGIVIASSGTISVTGSILANGGVPVSTGTTDGRGTQGGAGSGGAIRLIATTVSGNGTISAAGGSFPGESGWQYGSAYYLCSYIGLNNYSNYGGLGRIRIEAESLQRTTATNPGYYGGSPSLVFVPGMPTLTIDSVGGIATPATPTGVNDVALPSTFTNPVTVTFVTSGVTVGSTIKLTVIPPKGQAFSATSAATTGTAASATSSVAVTLPSGAVTLQATVTYTVVASVGDAMSVYAQGERVEKVTLASTFGSKESTATLTTVSGKEYVVPASALLRLQG